VHPLPPAFGRHPKTLNESRRWATGEFICKIDTKPTFAAGEIFGARDPRADVDDRARGLGERLGSARVVVVIRRGRLSQLSQHYPRAKLGLSQTASVFARGGLR
jgi:hypothetical protein